MHRPLASPRLGRASVVVAVGILMIISFASAGAATPVTANSDRAVATNSGAPSVHPVAAAQLTSTGGAVPGAARARPPHPMHGGHELPCDVYAKAKTPCVAAHSTVRALYKSYDGYLYQISRASDLQTINIGVTSRGGYADSAAQDKFCAATTCVIATIFDQSPQRNDLVVEAGDHGASATALPVWVGGHKVYGLKVTQGVGYRHTHAAGVATNGQPESMYMVASGPVNSGCCFDYGNTENTQTDTGAGHMDALNYSAGAGGLWYTGGGTGPWIMADMENGVFAGPNHSGSVPFNPKNTGNASPVVTGLLKNDGQRNWALKGGNASSGALTTWYDGALPSGWAPMHQEGSIVLGTGGDNSHADIGSFYEGVMTAALTSDASDNAVQANIVSRYQDTRPPPGPPGPGNVSVGADGTVIGVTPDGRVFRYTGTDPQARTEIPGKLLTRAAVRSANDIWGRAPDGTIWRYTGGGWAQIAGNGIDIAAGSDGTVWRTDATGTYKWTGQTSTTDPAVNWALVPGSSLNGIARLVEASGKSATDLWGVSNGALIWHYDGTSWTQITGGLIWVSEGSDGTVEGVAPDNLVYRYTGTGGLPFVQLPGQLEQLSVGTINNVWAVNTSGDIIRTTP